MIAIITLCDLITKFSTLALGSFDDRDITHASSDAKISPLEHEKSFMQLDWLECCRGEAKAESYGRKTTFNVLRPLDDDARYDRLPQLHSNVENEGVRVRKDGGCVLINYGRDEVAATHFVWI